MYSIPFIPKPRTSTVWKDSSNNTKGTHACYQQPEKKRYYQHSRSPHFCILPKDNYCCDLTINGLNLRFVHVASSCSSIVWINLNLVFHPVDVHFDSFLFGLIMNRGTVKIVVHDLVRAYVHFSSVYVWDWNCWELLRWLNQLTLSSVWDFELLYIFVNSRFLFWRI